MFRKAHPMERTANVPDSQRLKNKASDIISHLNGRRADILNVLFASGFLTGGGKAWQLLETFLIIHSWISWGSQQKKTISPMSHSLSLHTESFFLVHMTAKGSDFSSFTPLHFHENIQQFFKKREFQVIFQGHTSSKPHPVGLDIGY